MPFLGNTQKNIDRAFSTAVFHWFSNRENALEEIRKVLCIGGLYTFTVHSITFDFGDRGEVFLQPDNPAYKELERKGRELLRSRGIPEPERPQRLRMADIEDLARCTGFCVDKFELSRIPLNKRDIELIFSATARMYLLNVEGLDKQERSGIAAELIASVNIPECSHHADGIFSLRKY